MLTFLKYMLLALVSTMIVMLIFLSCEKDTLTWNDPHPAGRPAAVISSINPDTAYAGETVTITGTDFSTTLDENLVFFGKTKAQVISSSETTLEVSVPPGGGKELVTVDVKIAKQGALNWSNLVNFTYSPVIENLLSISDLSGICMGVAVDEEGNLYWTEGKSKLVKWKPGGEMTVIHEGHAYNNGMPYIGPDGLIYACGCGMLFSYNLDGTVVDTVALDPFPWSYAWDSQGTLYFSHWGIDRYNGDGTATTISERYRSGEVVIYNDYAYIIKSRSDTLFKYQINNGTLGAPDVIKLDVADPGKPRPDQLCMDSEGTIYYRNAGVSALYYIKSDGSRGKMFEGELSPSHKAQMHGKFMYLTGCGAGDDDKLQKVYIGVEGIKY